MTNTGGQRLCLWMGPVSMVLLGIGFLVFAGFVPPPSPALSAQEIGALYVQKGMMIRVGCVVMIFACAAMVFWVGLISALMRRIPGTSEALVYAQMVGGCSVMTLIVIPLLIWGVAGFRPDRNPDLVLLLNDLAWFLLLVPAGPAVAEVMCIGIAILGDKSPDPLFPRWSGFFNLWMGVLFVPGVMAMFFKTGPFAWDGLLPFWIPVSAFFLWFGVMFLVLGGVIRKQEATAAVRGVPAAAA